MTDPNTPAPRGPNAPRPGTKAGGFAALDPKVAGGLAGLVSALFTGAVVLGLPFLTALYFFAPLPILLVGFSHGPVGAIVAAVTAAVAMGAVAGPLAALAAAASAGVPAAYAAYLLNLARPADELGGPSDRLAWYPLADVLLRVCLTVAAGAVVIGVAIGYDATTVAALLEETFLAGVTDADLAQQGLTREGLAAAVTGLVPVAQPFTTVLVLVGNIYLAGRVARSRGLTDRPPDDMPLSLRLPTLALAIFGIALAFSFMDGPLALAARTVAGALGAGFTIAGYAILHHRLRGNAARGMVLVLVYVTTVLFTLPAFIMLGLGLFSTARAVPMSKRT